MSAFFIWIFFLNLIGFITIVLCGFGRTIFDKIRNTVEDAIRRAKEALENCVNQIKEWDPVILSKIKSASTKSTKVLIEKKLKKKMKFKNAKKKIKNEVYLELERDIQESSMNNMRPLIEKTIDAMVELTLLEEISENGDIVGITIKTSLGKIIWRVFFPLTIASFAGWLSYNYPDKILPGSMIIPIETGPPVAGPPSPIDPINIFQSIAINGAVYGISALVLIGLIIALRKKIIKMKYGEIIASHNWCFTF